MGYLARLAAGDGALRPTLTRTLEWSDDETLGEIIPDPGSRFRPSHTKTDRLYFMSPHPTSHGFRWRTRLDPTPSRPPSETYTRGAP